MPLPHPESTPHFRYLDDIYYICAAAAYIAPAAAAGLIAVFIKNALSGVSAMSAGISRKKQKRGEILLAFFVSASTYFPGPSPDKYRQHR